MKEEQILINDKVEIIAHKGDAVWAMDSDYRLTAFNPSFKKRFREEFRTMPKMGSDLKPIYDKGNFFSLCSHGCDRALNQYATTSRHSFVEDGQTLVHEFSFQPFMDGSGKVIGCCIWQKDITEEMEIVHRLRESEIKYKEAQEITNVGHWNWDMKRDNIVWSDQLFRVFGQAPGKFKATYEALLDIIHPEDRDAFNEDVNRSVQKKVPHDMVHRIVVGDGEIRYVHEKGRTFYDGNGNPYRMSGTTQDVTKEVLANQQIIQQNNELQNFVRIISHNLRSPISNLLMLSKIYDWGKDEENDDIVRKIEHTTEALDQTIKDLNHSLSLKNVDKAQFKDIELAYVMKDIKGLLSEEIYKAKAKIVTDFSKAESVFGLKSYLVNILYNLTLNAINYAKEETIPVVQLSTEETDDAILLKVSDNGIGMELTPEKERKIFDMYGRLSGATEGKGLGLYLVKTQVEAMNGKIEVQSEKDVGTTFIIHFEK